MMMAVGGVAFLALGADRFFFCHWFSGVRECEGFDRERTPSKSWIFGVVSDLILAVSKVPTDPSFFFQNGPFQRFKHL